MRADEMRALLAAGAEAARADGADWRRVDRNDGLVIWLADRWGHSSDDLEHAADMAEALLDAGWLRLDADLALWQLRESDPPSAEDRERETAAWSLAAEIASAS